MQGHAAPFLQAPVSSSQLLSELHHAEEDLCLLWFHSLFLLILAVVTHQELSPAGEGKATQEQLKHKTADRNMSQTRHCHAAAKQIKDSLYS